MKRCCSLLLCFLTYKNCKCSLVINSLKCQLRNIVIKRSDLRSPKYWSFTKISSYMHNGIWQKFICSIFFPSRVKWQGLTFTKVAQTPKRHRLHHLHPHLNSTDLNKSNVPIYKNLGKREPNFPITLSWDSQSGTPYWVYKLITSKKYTIKKPQKASSLKKPFKQKKNAHLQNKVQTSGTTARDQLYITCLPEEHLTIFPKSI